MAMHVRCRNDYVLRRTLENANDGEEFFVFSFGIELWHYISCLA